MRYYASTNPLTATGRTLIGSLIPRGKADNGLRTLFVNGTFGGTSATFQLSRDGTNFEDITNATFTANGSVNIFVGSDPVKPTQLYINLTGGAGISLMAGFEDLKG